MSEELVSIGSFPTDVEANFVKSRLEEAGVPAYVEGEAVAGLGLSNVLGGARVLVARSDVQRALALLTEAPDDEPAPSAGPASEAITDRRPASTAITDEPDEPDEDEGPPHNAREDAADRALAWSIVGVALWPAQLYVLWLLLKVFFSDEPLRDKVRWRPWLALALSLPVALGLLLALRAMFAD